MSSTGWRRNSRGEYYVAVQMVLLGLVLVGPRYAGPWDGPWSAAASIAGVLLGGAGLVLCVAGGLRLGPRNLTPLPMPKDGATLVEDGVYAVVRHPIYGGLTLAALGWALIWRSPATLGLSIVLFIFFELKSRREEQWLLQRFPEYPAYRRRVKKLIPLVY